MNNETDPAAPRAPLDSEPEFDYPAAARSLHLNLREFCDESEPFPLMIANAGRKAAAALASARAALDATPQQLYEEMLAKKLAWFADAGEADAASHTDMPDERLIYALRENLHFAPTATHWAINTAIARIESRQAALDAKDADNDEYDRLLTRLGNILRDTANALKGEPKPLHEHSWHDLPEAATALQSALDEAKRREEAHFEAIDDVLSAMRDPMTLDDAYRARAALTHYYVGEKKRRVLATRSAYPVQEQTPASEAT